MAIFPRWVRLYFDKSLPDPEGLLEGSGAKVRSVTLKTASDLDHAHIQALFKAAIEHSGVTFRRPLDPHGPSSRKSKKRRPRRTGTPDPPMQWTEPAGKILVVQERRRAGSVSDRRYVGLNPPESHAVRSASEFRDNHPVRHGGPCERESRSKRCPSCNLWNPSSASRFDCGYDFLSGQVKSHFWRGVLRSRCRSRAGQTEDALGCDHRCGVDLDLCHRPDEHRARDSTNPCLGSLRVWRDIVCKRYAQYRG